MPKTFKLSITCDTLDEMLTTVELLRGRKEPEHVACTENTDDHPADSGSGGETCQRDQSPPPENQAPKRRGRPKVDKAEVAPTSAPVPAPKQAQASLPGAVTLEALRIRARKFAQSWGAPALSEALGSYGAKSTMDLDPKYYAPLMDTMNNFSMQGDDPADPEADPFSDLLGG